MTWSLETRRSSSSLQRGDTFEAGLTAAIPGVASVRPELAGRWAHAHAPHSARWPAVRIDRGAQIPTSLGSRVELRR